MLSGQRLYLDLQDKLLALGLEAQIQQHGGHVEKFLSKDITCVVTSKTKSTAGKGKGDPKNPGLATKQQKTPCLSRGKALLLQSKQKNATPNDNYQDPLQFADKFGVKCLHIKEFLQTHKIKLHKQGKVKENVSKATGATYKTKALTGSCIKFEDVGQLFKPQAQTFPRFPHIMDLHATTDNQQPAKPRAKSPSSPNSDEQTESEALGVNAKQISAEQNAPVVKEPHKKMTKHCNKKPVCDKKQDDTGKHRTKAKVSKRKADGVEKKQSGYCESCDVFYDKLSVHVRSSTHLNFAANKENFAVLDETISKLPDITDLLSSVSQDFSTKLSSRQSEETSPVPPEKKVTSGQFCGSVSNAEQTQNKVISHSQSNIGQTRECQETVVKPEPVEPTHTAQEYKPLFSDVSSAEDVAPILSAVEPVVFSSVAPKPTHRAQNAIDEGTVCKEGRTPTNAVASLPDRMSLHEALDPTEFFPKQAKFFDVDRFLDGDRGSARGAMCQSDLFDTSTIQQIHENQLSSSLMFPDSWMDDASFPDSSTKASTNTPLHWSSATSVGNAGWDMDRVYDHVMGILEQSESDSGCKNTARLPLQELCQNRPPELVDGNSNSVSSECPSNTVSVQESSRYSCEDSVSREGSPMCHEFLSAKTVAPPQVNPSVASQDGIKQELATQPTASQPPVISAWATLTPSVEPEPLNVPAQIPLDESLCDLDIGMDDDTITEQMSEATNQLNTPPHVPSVDDLNPLSCGSQSFSASGPLDNQKHPVELYDSHSQAKEPEQCDKIKSLSDSLQANKEADLSTAEHYDDLKPADSQVHHNVLDVNYNEPPDANIKQPSSQDDGTKLVVEDGLLVSAQSAESVAENVRYLHSVLNTLNNSMGDTNVKPNVDQSAQIKEENLEEKMDVDEDKLRLNSELERTSPSPENEETKSKCGGIKLKISLKHSSCVLLDKAPQSCEKQVAHKHYHSNSTSGDSCGYTSSDSSEGDSCSESPQQRLHGIRDNNLCHSSGDPDSDYHNHSSSEGEVPVPKHLDMSPRVNTSHDTPWTVRTISCLKMNLRRVTSTPHSQKLAPHVAWQVRQSGDCKLTLSAQKQQQDKHYDSDQTLPHAVSWSSSRRRKLQL